MADDTRVTLSRPGLACVFALLCALGCALPASALAGDIIVRRDSGLTAAERAQVRAGAGVELDRMLTLPDTEVVSVPDAREDNALARLNADPDVRFAVRDTPFHVAAVPEDDPEFRNQWALDSGPLPDIDVKRAWTESEGDGVTVAVIDQAVDVTHPDLAGQVADGGADFTRPDGCTVAMATGLEDHGTLIAGQVAAGHNGIGIIGVAPAAKVLPLRAMNNCGSGQPSWISLAMNAAGDAGVPVAVIATASNPLASQADKDGWNRLFADALRRNQDTLFVVSSGNLGNDNDQLPVYPCNTVDPTTGLRPANLVCVGATLRTDAPVCWGNVGLESVDLFAPGVEILSTAAPGQYLYARGTSMSAAIVAGVAALGKHFDEAASAASLKERLLSTVTTIPGLDRRSVSGGRVNAANVVEVRGGIGQGGAGGQWTTCDADHDGFLNQQDSCPAAYGTLLGCPDADGDGVRDLDDNCPAHANPDRADADGDGTGDVCDPTPLGDDADGDGRARLIDRCPTVYGTDPDGCPRIVQIPTPIPTATPTPTPWESAEVRVTKFGVTLTPKTCPRGRPGCQKSAKFTLRLSRSATVSLRVEQKAKRNGRTVWKRIATKSIKATTSARSTTVRRLKKGSYRVTASVAGKATTRSFRV